MNNNYLKHYGVLGMKWGVRKKESSKVKFSTKRRAKKDAKEYARAKMFYGEGAGNRRKLIKSTVEARSKNLKGYKEEFEKKLEKQDMSKHASAAKRERAARTARKTTAKTARGLINIAVGNVAKAGAFAIGVYAVGQVIGVNAQGISNFAKTAVSNTAAHAKMGAYWVKIMMGKRH